MLYQADNGINYPIKKFNIKICTNNEPQAAKANTYLIFY